MKRIMACVIMLIISNQFAWAETLIIWSKQAKACGPDGYTYRAGYTLEALPTVDMSVASERLRNVIAIARSEGAEHVDRATVPARSCIAIAYMDKQVGSCAWRTFTWKIARDENTARADIERVLRNEVNLKASMVQEVRCANPPQPPGETYSAGGIRG